MHERIILLKASPFAEVAGLGHNSAHASAVVRMTMFVNSVCSMSMEQGAVALKITAESRFPAFQHCHGAAVLTTIVKNHYQSCSAHPRLSI